MTPARGGEYVHRVNSLETRSESWSDRMALDATPLSVLRLLAASPHMSQREVASSVGVSLGKAHYCLRALIAKGLVKAKNYRKSSNKVAYLYLLTPEGVAAKADLTRRFLERKVKEYEALRQEIEELERESELAAELSSVLSTPSVRSGSHL